MSAFFKNLFRPKPVLRPSSEDVKTAPLTEEELEAVTQPETVHQPAQYLAACAQSVGLQREHNEDTLYILTTLLANGSNDIPVGVFIIADGMGGHEHGEVVSAVATRSMAEYMITHLYRLFLGEQNQTQSESIQEILENGVAAAQQAVLDNAPGGGTTLTAVLAIGDRISLAHVGDSRAYLISPSGEMHSITHDHSMVQRLLELGQITEEESRIHPNRNVLYRAVGQSEPLHPDIQSHEFPHPGCLLLCSDGLWGVLSDAEIFRIIRTHADSRAACQALVDAANAEGGPDNISVILVNYPT